MVGVDFALARAAARPNASWHIAATHSHTPWPRQQGVHQYLGTRVTRGQERCKGSVRSTATSDAVLGGCGATSAQDCIRCGCRTDAAQTVLLPLHPAGFSAYIVMARYRYGLYSCEPIYMLPLYRAGFSATPSHGLYRPGLVNNPIQTWPCQQHTSI